MSKVIRIVAFVVDTSNLTMYTSEGTSIIVKQGDPRTKPLVDQIHPEITAHGFCDIDTETMKVSTTFADAEKQLGGVVKFFRGFKKKIAEILGGGSEPEFVEPMSVGSWAMPATAKEEEAARIKEETKPQTKSEAAVAAIMAHAVPTHSPEFDVADPDEETTVVAILEDGTVIPDMENIEHQLLAMAKGLGSVEGLTNFFKRVASHPHAHSVKDLLTFMKKGELPIADDGSILVYKRLKRTTEDGVFVDCHSGNVKQRVGSHVFMDAKLVNPDRSIECSNGLHIARRDYLPNFSGNVCVLAKLAPEDVIAVPHKDASKLRAKGYHIIAELSQEDHDLVVDNKPLKDTQLLGNAVAGKHIGIIETVEINSSNGGGLVITPVNTEEYTQEESGRHSESLDVLVEPEPEGTTVNARELALGKTKPDQFITAPPGGVVAETRIPMVADLPSEPVPKAAKLSVLESLLRDWGNAHSSEEMKAAAESLISYKKSTKRSWISMNIGAAVVEQLNEAAKYVAPVIEKPVKVTKAKPVAKKPVKATVKAAAKVTVTKTKSGATVVKAKAAKGQNLRDVIGKEVTATKVKPANGFPSLLDSFSKKPTRANAQALVDFKKKSKKSWTSLGVSDETVIDITAALV